MFVDHAAWMLLSDFQDWAYIEISILHFLNVRYPYHCNLVYVTVAVYLALLHISLGQSRVALEIITDMSIDACHFKTSFHTQTIN